MALSQLELPNENLKQMAIARTLDWIATMQCNPGGWGAFDLDNDQDWLNALPYADLKAMIDPNTADVTARVVEMIGYIIGIQTSTFTTQISSSPDSLSLIPTSQNPARLTRALDYLTAEQESEGCWYGRWGVNYIYGTSGALSALALVAPTTHRRQIEKGAAWLVSCQNSDGGWGETCFSYNDPSLKGQGDSTASQTAWALIGLMAAGDVTGQPDLDAIQNGVRYLIATQLSDGRWDEPYFTGTGFPGHFYLKYHMYQQYFPLIALGRYQARFG
jgi:squalene-hopene/tetraprenyl-beta-curcumene cyclase